jgi:hypothetical protein
MRMNAYYYAFQPTGVEAIDRILSAVACAGKAYHHTSQWTDDVWDYDAEKQRVPSPYEPFLRGWTPAEWIQNAANDAAALLAASEAAREEAQRGLRQYQDAWDLAVKEKHAAESAARREGERERARKAWGEFVRVMRVTTLDDIKWLRREGKLDDPRVKAADAWEAALESLLAPPTAEHADDCSLGKHGHPYEAVCDCGRDVTAWLIERTIDGVPHWMRWRDRDRCEWVTDANLADRFTGSEVYREARLIAKSQGVECRATEHMFIPAPAPPAREREAPTDQAGERERAACCGCICGCCVNGHSKGAVHTAACIEDADHPAAALTHAHEAARREGERGREKYLDDVERNALRARAESAERALGLARAALERTVAYLGPLHKRLYEHTGAMNATALGERDYGRTVIQQARALLAPPEGTKA